MAGVLACIQMTAHVQDCVVEELFQRSLIFTHTQTGMTFFVHFKLQTVASDQNIDPIHIIASSMKKIVSNESGEQSAMIKHCSRAKQSKTLLNKHVGGF